MSDAQIQNKQTFDDEKIQNAYKNQKLSTKKIPEWFGLKPIEPIGFHDNVVVIQRKDCLVWNWLLCGLIHPDVFVIFWVQSKSFWTHWHIALAHH